MTFDKVGWWRLPYTVVYAVKHSPLLRRWSWCFSSNSDVKSSLCLTSSAIISSLSSESDIFCQKRKSASVNHLCTKVKDKRHFAFDINHLVPQFFPSLVSTHQKYCSPASPRSWSRLPQDQVFSLATPDNKNNTMYYLTAENWRKATMVLFIIHYSMWLL